MLTKEELDNLSEKEIKMYRYTFLINLHRIEMDDKKSESIKYLEELNFYTNVRFKQNYIDFHNKWKNECLEWETSGKNLEDDNYKLKKINMIADAEQMYLFLLIQDYNKIIPFKFILNIEHNIPEKFILDITITDNDFKSLKINKNESLDKYEKDPAMLKKAEEASENLSKAVLPKELQ